jgi:hypothetical protein
VSEACNILKVDIYTVLSKQFFDAERSAFIILYSTAIFRCNVAFEPKINFFILDLFGSKQTACRVVSYRHLDPLR